MKEFCLRYDAGNTTTGAFNRQLLRAWVLHMKRDYPDLATELIRDLDAEARDAHTFNVTEPEDD